MSLNPGIRLGSYEVLAPIGAGGMGEVFRARDARLNRDVAIKVLPAAFAADPDRRARFEREAQAVATLSHPNIVVIHDTGVQPSSGPGEPDRAFVVMELLVGQTLRERLGGGTALPVRKAIDIGVQIARGLGAAHGKGIVHRDLKPENIFVLADGQVKILDFGLARQATTDHSGATETQAATNPGTVMGTMGYMAPEQVRGQQVDARADLFAFGAVLYEMVGGRRAFHRETGADTMSAILKEDPPELSGSRPELSPALDRIIRHCLEKNPNERFQSARDVAFALEALSGAGSASGAIPSQESKGESQPPLAARRALLPWVAGLILAAVAAAGAYALGKANRVEAGSVHFEPKTWDQQWVTNARFAPDGQTIVFSSAMTGSVPSLFVIRPGSFLSQQVGKAGAHLLSVSSTGELAVLVDPVHRNHRIFGGTLSRVTMDGAARPWMQDVMEADWSPDGSTLAVTRLKDGKVQLEYPIGTVLHETSNGYISDLRVSPDGKQVVFVDHPGASDNRGFLKVTGPAGVRTLSPEYKGVEGTAWSRDGRSVLFSAVLSGSASQAGSEDLQLMSVNVTGEPNVRLALPGTDGMIVHDVAADGRTLITQHELRISVRGLAPGETVEREYPWLNMSVFGFFTRDGRHMAFIDQSQSAGADYATAIRDVASGQVVRLGPGRALEPSPDGKWVPALVTSTGRMVLYPTGTGDPVTLEKGTIENYAPSMSWSPDSKRVIVCGNQSGRPPRCFEQEVPAGTPNPVTREGVSAALLAPDGRTLLATTSGGYEIVTTGGGAPVPVKVLGPADVPITWTADSRDLIVSPYGETPSRIQRVSLTTGNRTTLRELAPPDRAGLIGLLPNQWMDDGRAYSYTYFRALSRVFVVTGVR